MPKQICFFFSFLWLFCDNLEFRSVKSSKIFTAHRNLWDTNFKHEKKVGFVTPGFSTFANVCLSLREKIGLIRFPEKRAPTKSARFHGISQKETRENSLSVLLFVLMLT